LGCHFIHNIQPAYEFLTKLLGIEFIDMNDQPSFIISKEKQVGSIKNLITPEYRYISCRKFQMINSIKDSFHQKNLRLLSRAVLNLFFHKPYKYPNNGCSELMSHFKKKMEQSRVEIFHNSKANNFNITAGQSGTLKINSSTIKFNSLIISRHSKITNISIDNKVIQYNSTNRYKKHFVLKIQGTKRKGFSYLDILNDDVIRRVSDVGIYVPDLPSNVLLICCDVTGTYGLNNSDEIIQKNIFHRLIKYGIVELGAIYIDCEIEKYDLYDTESKDLQSLTGKSKSIIQVIDTGFLGQCIMRYKEKWKSELLN
jgi:hypothetical protein